MNNSKAMGLGCMLLFLVLAVVLLPIVVRFIDKMEPHYASGFENMVKNVNVPKGGMKDSYRPDANTDYLCRSPNGGEPCPEGSFCDGASQSCIKSYVGGNVPDVGYYA
jgi:hypothetical protein